MSSFKAAGLIKSRLACLIVFAVSMGFLEASVVVYLREILYPGGFVFPLKMIPPFILFTEQAREISTILMLASVSLISGRDTYSRSAYFLIVFGIWDIFYYIFLKMMLDWPESFLTWDILFLIPVTWIGPVLAPVICSLTMIILGAIVLNRRNSGFSMKAGHFALLFSGAAMIFVTFIYDFSSVIIKNGFAEKILSLPENPEFAAAVSGFVPARYGWELFALGEALIMLSVLLALRKRQNPRGLDIKV
ncbi:MAG: hypothetical protein JXJ19_07935 [Elusimicrobia bacterium]|nr:hypothetical protein [Elusimicrobiota bacterium]